MRMACARAAQLEGPYEVNPEISSDEDFGLAQGNRLQGQSGPPFHVTPGNPAARGHMSLHQGGIVSTPAGAWWGFAMMDANSVGRLTCLSPVTWQDGWPYFGLPGNLRRTPRTWVKPDTGAVSSPSAPFERSDDFAGPRLKPVWQWNHLPDDTRWSLTDRPGFLRLRPLAAPDFWHARDSLTQRAVGPASTATVLLDGAGLQAGDVAGLAVLNLPYAWIGVRHRADGFALEQFNQLTGQTSRAPLAGPRAWLRVSCDFLRETAAFSASPDGKNFRPLGGEFTLVFQLKTFQGARFALFAFNDAGAPGGRADFADFAVTQPHPQGLMRPIPYGRSIALTLHGRPLAVGVQAGAIRAVPEVAAGRFTVIDGGLGRVRLRAYDGRLLTVTTANGQTRATLSGEVSAPAATAFQWIENVYGDMMLLSLATDRYLRIDPATGVVTADHPGPAPDRRDGSCFDWNDNNP
jgi:hypothetical protein